jgi:miniconductance mechanosensitive channel
MDRLQSWLHEYSEFSSILGLVGLCLFAYAMQALTRWYLKRWNVRSVRLMRDPRMVSALSWVLPLLVFYFGFDLLPELPRVLTEVVERVVLVSFIVLGLRLCTILLDDFNKAYAATEAYRTRPIKGYLQGISILIHFLGLVSIVAVLLDRSPLVFLSGLGAATAILVLVFKDTILSMVAGVQLTYNRLIQVGDWIEIPQFGADGDVVEIALHTVTVRNWDNTHTVIPAHKFLENSFKNWRGMRESGGRRIKRSVFLDVHSIRFLEEADIAELKKFKLLREYLDQKVQELQAIQEPETINRRRLTNLGTFRHYLVQYLKAQSGIHQNMSLMVRQLQATPEGLPLEIYAFTSDTRWSVHENLQSDIFDHVFAIIPEFGLKVFQSPSGDDFKEILPGKRPS